MPYLATCHPCQGSPLLLCSSAAGAVIVRRPQSKSRPNGTAPHLPRGGEIKTLKLATKSAFCLVPRTSGPQNSCRQSNVRMGVAACQPWIEINTFGIIWVHLDCEVDMSKCATPNALYSARTIAAGPHHVVHVLSHRTCQGPQRDAAPPECELWMQKQKLVHNMT